MQSVVQPQPIAAQPVSVTHTMAMTTQDMGMWGSGVCDCCDDMGICCCAFWCFPCFQCSTVSNFGECLCLPLLDPSCAAYCGTSTVCPPVAMAMRAAVRERYKIRGSICDDCCTLYCCLTCSWCQMAREIKRRKQPFSLVTAQTTTVSMPVSPQPYPPYPQPYPPNPQPYATPQPKY
ncbi:cornifelin homolog [Hyperolius riggenbachi]|uniref:cornifelin homolog n=1 Tax=Hyperolius riggenbachi TaxID=752182 RepID=UPI0035A27532